MPTLRRAAEAVAACVRVAVRARAPLRLRHPSSGRAEPRTARGRVVPRAGRDRGRLRALRFGPLSGVGRRGARRDRGRGVRGRPGLARAPRSLRGVPDALPAGGPGLARRRAGRRVFVGEGVAAAGARRGGGALGGFLKGGEGALPQGERGAKDRPEGAFGPRLRRPFWVEGLARAPKPWFGAGPQGHLCVRRSSSWISYPSRRSAREPWRSPWR